jgi:hypothetical protein
VIATQVARTDRRALSEAWYSALHLAHGPVAARGAHVRHVPLASAPAPRAQRDAGAATGASTPNVHGPARIRSRQPGEVHGIASVERRRPACETSRRVERAVTTLATRWNGHAAQTIDVAGGRVRLLVRADRGATRIIAVCSAPLREPVERALAHARFALAATGVPIGAP